MRRYLVPLALGMAACGSHRPAAPPERADAGETRAIVDAGSTGEGPDGGEAASDAETAVPSPDAGVAQADPVTRFVAVGDTGKGNDVQYAVAAAMKTVCDARGGCDFGLLLGDNFYPTGVQAADDQQFQTKFERPYASLPFPFHPALGNHDYGGNGSGVEFWKGQSEIEYSQRSPKWLMPAAYYRFTEGVVDFVALDTNGILLSFGDKADQDRDVPRWIGEATAPWRIAYGHHPYVSNGPHGNAGAYDRITFDFIPAGGRTVKDFVEKNLCGRIDAYLCGHDHSLQDLGSLCGTQFLISGGGAGATDLPGTNASEFQAAAPGFLLVEATRHRLVLTFFDQAARELHERTVTK